MKSLFFALMLSVSCVAAAAVSTQNAAVKKVGIVGTDMSKYRVEAPMPADSDSVLPAVLADGQKYNGVVSMDNVVALENMFRLLQDNPEELYRQLTGITPEQGGIKANKQQTGKTQAVASYQQKTYSEDAGERFAELSVPDLTGSLGEMRESKAQLKAMHAAALQQIESVGQQKLAESAPIQQLPTVEDILNSGVDLSALPQDWASQLTKAQEDFKEYQRKKEAGELPSDEEIAKLRAEWEAKNKKKLPVMK